MSAPLPPDFDAILSLISATEDSDPHFSPDVDLVSPPSPAFYHQLQQKYKAVIDRLVAWIENEMAKPDDAGGGAELGGVSKRFLGDLMEGLVKREDELRKLVLSHPPEEDPVPVPEEEDTDDDEEGDSPTIVNPVVRPLGGPIEAKSDEDEGEGEEKVEEERPRPPPQEQQQQQVAGASSSHVEFSSFRSQLLETAMRLSKDAEEAEKAGRSREALSILPGALILLQKTYEDGTGRGSRGVRAGLVRKQYEQVRARLDELRRKEDRRRGIGVENAAAVVDTGNDVSSDVAEPDPRPESKPKPAPAPDPAPAPAPDPAPAPVPDPAPTPVRDADAELEDMRKEMRTVMGIARRRIRETKESPDQVLALLRRCESIKLRILKCMRERERQKIEAGAQQEEQDEEGEGEGEPEQQQESEFGFERLSADEKKVEIQEDIPLISLIPKPGCDVELQRKLFDLNSVLLNQPVVEILKERIARNEDMQMKRVLLVGPPGAGKTYLSKCVAFSDRWLIRGPSLRLSMTLVRSEAVLEETVRMLSDDSFHSSGLLLLDDLDRLQPQLEACLIRALESLHDTATVTVIACAQSLWTISPDLLRCFGDDDVLVLQLPSSPERQLFLETSLRAFPFGGETSLNSDDFEFLARRTEGFCAADLASVINTARRYSDLRLSSAYLCRKSQDFKDADCYIICEGEREGAVPIEQVDASKVRYPVPSLSELLGVLRGVPRTTATEWYASYRHWWKKLKEIQMQ